MAPQKLYSNYPSLPQRPPMTGINYQHAYDSSEEEDDDDDSQVYDRDESLPVNYENHPNIQSNNLRQNGFTYEQPPKSSKLPHKPSKRAPNHYSVDDDLSQDDSSDDEDISGAHIKEEPSEEEESGIDVDVKVYGRGHANSGSDGGKERAKQGNNMKYTHNNNQDQLYSSSEEQQQSSSSESEEGSQSSSTNRNINEIENKIIHLESYLKTMLNKNKDTSQAQQSNSAINKKNHQKIGPSQISYQKATNNVQSSFGGGNAIRSHTGDSHSSKRLSPQNNVSSGSNNPEKSTKPSLTAQQSNNLPPRPPLAAKGGSNNRMKKFQHVNPKLNDYSQDEKKDKKQTVKVVKETNLSKPVNKTANVSTQQYEIQKEVISKGNLIKEEINVIEKTTNQRELLQENTNNQNQTDSSSKQQIQEALLRQNQKLRQLNSLLAAENQSLKAIVGEQKMKKRNKKSVIGNQLHHLSQFNRNNPNNSQVSSDNYILQTGNQMTDDPKLLKEIELLKVLESLESKLRRAIERKLRKQTN